MKLQLDNVSFRYKSKVFQARNVFDGLSLTINSSETVAIVGDEGSGKSTLLQLLDGLLRPDSGRVLNNSENIWSEPKKLPQIRRRIGFAFQFPEQQFFCETVKDELCFALRNFGVSDDEDEKARAVLSEVGLFPDRYLSASPFSLSMGEARRVALASAILHEPETILLDEPTAGLDGHGVQMVLNLLKRLKERGKTIIIATHELELVSSIIERVIWLDGGNVKLDRRAQQFESSVDEFARFSYR